MLAGDELQLVDWNRFARARLTEPGLCALERTRDSIQKLGDMPCVGIGLVERLRQQRASKCFLAGERSLGEPLQLRGVLTVQRDRDAKGSQAVSVLWHWREKIRPVP